jgi:hypothetical protein
MDGADAAGSAKTEKKLENVFGTALRRSAPKEAHKGERKLSSQQNLDRYSTCGHWLTC